MNGWHPRPTRLLLGLVAASLATSAGAHHSALGYDLRKTSSATMTLKEMLWGAPHSAMVFMMTMPDGKVQEIQLGGAAPNRFVKQGFKPRDFKVGQKMAVKWHPAINGRPGGIIASVTLADGRTFHDTEFANLDAVNSNHFTSEGK